MPKRAAQEAAQGIPKRRPLTWEASFSREPLDRLAQQAQLGSRLLAIQPLALDATGRWLQVRLQGDQRAASLSLHALRRALGFGEWKSGLVISLDPHLPEFSAALQNEAAKSAATEANSFSTPIGPRGLTVRGLGRGHGVGLCQEGLHDYAAMGWTSHTILRHYYPGTEVVRLDP